ncbi:MAG: phosphodiester glycosidase family protein [Nocardioidaceae bacterium]
MTARPARHRRATATVVVAGLLLLPVLAGPGPTAGAATAPLPLGDADLVETRSVERLAPGVTLTRITRGTEKAPEARIGTTTRGPWRVSVLRIDPATATGRLRATYGPTLSQTESTTDLVRQAGALAGVNASQYDRGSARPGDPRGLGVYGGRLLSEPARTAPNEADVLVDSRTWRLRFGRFTWSGSVRNRSTGRVQRLAHVNQAPWVPPPCLDLTDQTSCSAIGQVSWFDSDPAAPTPSGPGVEVVVDRAGCVVSTSTSRGTLLDDGERSLQATGRSAASLLALTRRGCLARRVRLVDPTGLPVRMRPWLSAVSGRYQLASGGRYTVPSGSGDFFRRNPRTVVGTTAAGIVVLVTVDGRRASSVGTTAAETTALVRALGLRDAVNLDGGSSTTMVARGALVSVPSGPAEREVGDALVYVDGPTG